MAWIFLSVIQSASGFLKAVYTEAIPSLRQLFFHSLLMNCVPWSASIFLIQRPLHVLAIFLISSNISPAFATCLSIFDRTIQEYLSMITMM
jgi:hypothetical protein